KSIKVFNKGDMERDFTYVDDIVEGVVKVIEKPKESNEYKIYNIGNNSAVSLMDFIKEIEINLEKTAKKEMLPMQPGDVKKTWANVDHLINDYGYKPKTLVKDGVKSFIDWYKEYHKINNQKN